MADRIATFNGISGKVIQDGGTLISALVANPMTSPGDSIVGGASGVPTRLASPTTRNMVLRTTAAGTTLWGRTINASTEAILYEDFYMASGFTMATGTSGGTITQVPSVANHPGIVQLSSGATAGTSYFGVGHSATSMRLSGETYFETSVLIPVLSTAAQRFIVTLGCHDAALVNSAVQNGFYFSYTDNVISGNWQAITRLAATESTLNSAIPVVLNTWYKLSAIFNQAMTSVTFFVNDTSIGSLATTVPASAVTGAGMKIAKTVGGNLTCAVRSLSH